MWRWLRPRSRTPSALRPPARTLTHDQVRDWRLFVIELNARLAENTGPPGIHTYAERIREAVIHKRIPVEEFLASHPPPWRT